MAGGKWISVKFEILASLFVGAVAFSAIIMSQDGGEYVSKNIPSFDWVTESARKPKYLHGFIRIRWSVKGIVYYICVELREIRD